MNVSYKDINTKDAATMLKLHPSTVSGWCQRGVINFMDVSEKGSTVPRYRIPQDEINYIRGLIKKYGTLKKAMLFYKKDHWKDNMEQANKKQWEEPDIVEIKNPFEKGMKPEFIEVEDEKPAEEELTKKPTKFDIDKVTKTILYIQDIKERLEDLEAERNQLINELNECKKEVMEVL